MQIRCIVIRKRFVHERGSCVIKLTAVQLEKETMLHGGKKCGRKSGKEETGAGIDGIKTGKDGRKNGNTGVSFQRRREAGSPVSLYGGN